MRLKYMAAFVAHNPAAKSKVHDKVRRIRAFV